MNEDEAVKKMEDLMNSVETATKYSLVASKIPAVFLIVLAAIVEADFVTIAINFYNYSTVNTYLYNLPVGSTFSLGAGLVVVICWIPLAYIAYRIIRGALRGRMDQGWKSDLREGVVGILKIIEETDWESRLNDLKRAKLVFVFFSALQLMVSWAVTAVLLFFASIFLLVPLSITANPYLILVIAVVIVVGLGDTYIKGRYRQLWNMDNLISELRWFYLEFEGSGL